MNKKILLVAAVSGLILGSCSQFESKKAEMPAMNSENISVEMPAAEMPATETEATTETEAATETEMPKK